MSPALACSHSRYIRSSSCRSATTDVLCRPLPVVHGVVSSGTRQATATFTSRGQALEGANPHGSAGGVKAPPVFGQDPAKTYAISTTHAAFDGPANAKVTLVVAGDYACPYCEKVRDTMDELRK